MSYDFSGRVDTGGDEPHYIEPFFDDEHPALSGDGMAGNVMVTGRGYARCGNYTSNVSGMWSKCLTAAMRIEPDCGDYGATDGQLWLRDLDGWKLADIQPLLAAAVEWGIGHLDELAEDNPDNGWGNAEGAVTYLWDIQRFAEQHPKATLSLSY